MTPDFGSAEVEVTEQQIVDLIAELRKLGRECEWTEFKSNNENADEIAESVSALSNSAAIAGVEFGYLVWGIKPPVLLGIRWTLG
jgi:predicted HTH transcriptional regulator